MSLRPSWLTRCGFGVLCAALCLLATGCGGTKSASAHERHGTRSAAAPVPAPLTITPASGSADATPNQGITVAATSGGQLTGVSVRANGATVPGGLNATGTKWHSTWALDVSQRYAVTASATTSTGKQLTQTSSFRTFTPHQTFTAEILEGYHETYGVGMPIIVYFSRPVTDKAAVEKSLQVKTSKPVLGAWYWDSQCGTAPECLYFRPRHYWSPHTRITFTGHLDGVEAAPGVYGHHDLTQSFTIGDPLLVVASTATHYMKIYRNGKLFAHWPISTGRPGDDTPDGTYLTIEKANPVDMIGPGYNIEVPWSVRFTWSGDFLHDAYWSVGEQGFTNVSHGCVNMPPADAEIYYKMAVPGDPVKIVGSPAPGKWDNGWTMWFLSWRRWVKGSALHEAVQTGPHGSTFVSLKPHPPAATITTTTSTPGSTIPTTTTTTPGSTPPPTTPTTPTTP